LYFAGVPFVWGSLMKFVIRGVPFAGGGFVFVLFPGKPYIVSTVQSIARLSVFVKEIPKAGTDSCNLWKKRLEKAQIAVYNRIKKHVRQKI